MRQSEPHDPLCYRANHGVVRLRAQTRVSGRTGGRRAANLPHNPKVPMRIRALTPATLLLALAAAACDGGVSTAPTDGQLTQAEAAALNRSVFASGAQFANGTVPSGARGTRVTTSTGAGSFSFTFNTTNACDPSGTVALGGSMGGAYDVAAQTASVQANVAVQHQACAVKTQNGGTFTLTGSPKVDMTLNAAVGANGFTTLHTTETGGFAWQKSDGSSGTCTVNVTGDLVAATQTVKLTGTFCGFPIDETVSVSR